MLTICRILNKKMLNMDDNICARGYSRSSQDGYLLSCLHYYKVQIFNEVLDRNIVEVLDRNHLGDDWLSDLMICYVEKEIFAKFDDKKIMLCFHSYKDRRGHRPRHFRLPGINTT